MDARTSSAPLDESKENVPEKLSREGLEPYELCDLPNGLILAKNNSEARLLLLNSHLEVLDNMTVSKFKLEHHIIFGSSQVVIADTSNHFLDVHLFETRNKKIELLYSIRHRDSTNVTFRAEGSSSLSYSVVSPVEITKLVKVGENQVQINTQQLGAIMRRANAKDMIVRPHVERVKIVGSSLQFLGHRVSNNTSAFFDPNNKSTAHSVVETVREDKCLVM